MSLPAAVSSWLLVLVCAVSGAYCLGRVRRSGGAAPWEAGPEALMGFGMAVMAVPLGTGEGWRAPVFGVVFGVVFCAAALHAGWLLRGGIHHAHHLVGSLAMVYMALVPAAGHGSGGHGPGGHGAGLPLVTGTLLLYYAGYVVLGGARLVTAGGAATAPHPDTPHPGTPHPDTPRPGTPDAPAEMIRACRLAMGTGMLAMLSAM
ncbi:MULTISPECIES: DUF5134 domain-containing protein [unclassified Streptomyces]|uniref:DUF5134 domain-containing protein n=1 Tax=unclassified Streptomyces TaxID=2593676 RepID=UPI002256EC12|nr:MULTISPECIES: DUF5134 domain-containing protein [unclassified Streptomyces]MCX4524532.1 DUF5134 domain-containing protein [Streptomyces sp. NBC_01551]MCX4544944.1 DUF5134 domain-containing protein [Streptomyces sp. NBC_01565]